MFAERVAFADIRDVFERHRPVRLDPVLDDTMTGDMSTGEASSDDTEDGEEA